MVDGQSRSENASHKGRIETSSLQTLWPKLLYPEIVFLCWITCHQLLLGRNYAKKICILSIWEGFMQKSKRVNAC